MSAELTDADLPSHPDPHAWTWTDAEKRAILHWGQELLATRTSPAPGAPGQEAAAVQAVGAEAQDVAIRGLLCRLVDQLGERDRGGGNAPGHGHNMPGVWDSDNGAKAGTACAWCALWAEAKKVRAALSGSLGDGGGRTP